MNGAAGTSPFMSTGIFTGARTDTTENAGKNIVLLINEVGFLRIVVGNRFDIGGYISFGRACSLTWNTSLGCRATSYFIPRDLTDSINGFIDL
jgi:hypothetical protein